MTFYGVCIFLFYFIFYCLNLNLNVNLKLNTIVTPPQTLRYLITQLISLPEDGEAQSDVVGGGGVSLFPKHLTLLALM